MYNICIHHARSFQSVLKVNKSGYQFKVNKNREKHETGCISDQSNPFFLTHPAGTSTEMHLLMKCIQQIGNKKDLKINKK